MPRIRQQPPGPLPHEGDLVHLKHCPREAVYEVLAPGAVERGLAVWSVRVRMLGGGRPFWSLLSNVDRTRRVDLPPATRRSAT